MQPLKNCIGPTFRIGRESWYLMYAGFFMVLMPQWETRPDHVLWEPIVKCNFFQGTNATVGDGFAPLGSPLLPRENCMGREQDTTYIWTDIATTRPNWPSGPIWWKFSKTVSSLSYLNWTYGSVCRSGKSEEQCKRHSRKLLGFVEVVKKKKVNEGETYFLNYFPHNLVS